MWAQATFCGTGLNFQLDTIAWYGQSPPLVRFFDNTGKEYSIGDLQPSPTGVGGGVSSWDIYPFFSGQWYSFLF
jgi:hypothetical protein